MLAVAPFYVHAQAPLDPPLKNWPAPLYWQATPAPEEGSHQNRGGSHIAPDSTRGRFSPAAAVTSSSASVFVAVTPCRIVDTRVGQGQIGVWGPPALVGNARRDFPVTTNPNCTGIPNVAVAYSLNFTVVPSGPLLFLSAWPAGQPYPYVSTLNSPTGAIIANAAIVPAGTGGAISVDAGNPTDLIIDINGYYTAGDPTLYDLAVGVGALASNSGQANTAFGVGALAANTSGSTNTAVGAFALNQSTISADNTAVGNYALAANTGGTSNVAVGSDALYLNTGSFSSAVGQGALQANVVGNANTAVGQKALNLSTGSNNIAIGTGAGQNITAGDNNILIGNSAIAGDVSTIRIGNSQTKTLLAGVRGVTTGGSAIPVVIDPSGQLGTVSSSRRVKQDIRDMGDTTDTLMQLHPVQFRYISQGPEAPVQYGLIAEEVAEVAPELVARDSKGEIETVFYDKVNTMLLNEVQKQQRTIQEQATKIDEQASKLAALQVMVDKLVQAPKQ